MEQHRLEEVELRTSLAHLAAEVGDMRHELQADIRRLDDRIFQLKLLQLGTMATALAALAAALIS